MLKYRPILALGLFAFAATPAGAGNSSFDFSALKNLIETRGLTSIQAVLPLLPEEMRRNFVLMHSSLSLQGSSYEAPRAILHTADAKLIVAFNGAPEQRGFDDLEITQFNQAEKVFEYFTITFPRTGSTKPVFSEKNPERCLSCHRAPDPRPNWEPYPVWPGAYGGGDEDQRKEAPYWESFIARAKTDLRYSHLIFNALQPIDAMSELRNTRFTTAVSWLNFERLARQMVASPEYWRVRHAVAATLGCRHTRPEDVIPWTMSWLMPDGPPSVLPENPYAAEELLEHYWLFRNLFEKRGVSTRDWFLNLRPGDDNSLTNPGIANLELLATLLEADPELAPWVTRQEIGNGLNPRGIVYDCYGLRSKSLEVLQSVTYSR